MVSKHPLDNRLYVKRVTAIAGDTIFQKDKNFYLQIDSNQAKTFSYNTWKRSDRTKRTHKLPKNKNQKTPLLFYGRLQRQLKWQQIF